MEEEAGLKVHCSTIVSIIDKIEHRKVLNTALVELISLIKMNYSKSLQRFIFTFFD